MKSLIPWISVTVHLFLTMYRNLMTKGHFFLQKKCRKKFSESILDLATGKSNGNTVDKFSLFYLVTMNVCVLVWMTMLCDLFLTEFYCLILYHRESSKVSNPNYTKCMWILKFIFSPCYPGILLYVCVRQIHKPNNSRGPRQNSNISIWATKYQDGLFWVKTEAQSLAQAHKQ